jgi:hypothetical protein
MSALALCLMFESWVSAALLYLGVAMTLAATALYVQDGLRRLRHRPEASTST